MKLFECHPVLNSYESIEAFLTEIAVGADDLILTNRFLLDGDKAPINGAQILYQEAYGAGEPSDEMLAALRADVTRPYSRVIGVGGGTVLDLAKLLCLDWEGVDDIAAFRELMLGKRPVKKGCPVILVPTTCGTGSEVTNVAVVLLKSLDVKVGLANDALYAASAALVPSMLRTLPYRPMILSAIDALIHACESYLSPLATDLTRMFSEKAVDSILKSFVLLAAEGKTDDEMLAELLQASTMAGVAFGNAGCGMVHAMSYPIGGKYHLPHGESNYVVFLPVLRFYDEMTDKAPLEKLKIRLGKGMNVQPEASLDALEALLSKLCVRPTLADVGAADEDCIAFARSVWERQQRLLSKAMSPVTEADVLAVYRKA